MSRELETYLEQVFGTVPELSSATNLKGLPVLYSTAFKLFHGILQEQRCMFAVDQGKMRLTPAKLKKYIAFLANYFNIPVVYVSSNLGVHDAERLIAQQVPFIVPKKHLYLPFIATILSPEKNNTVIHREYLCLCAQLILTGVLLKKIASPVTIAGATDSLPFSRPAVIAALDELEYFGLGHKEKLPAGRKIVFRFTQTGKALWNEAQEFLRNPCKQTVGINELPEDWNVIPAGADALAQVTMLSEMPPSIFAIELAEFRKMECKTVPKDIAEIQLQLWLYPPAIFGENKIDTLSLTLSLKNDPDDRVQIAIEEFMKEFPW
jgi:hypothetical protein